MSDSDNDQFPEKYLVSPRKEKPYELDPFTRQDGMGFKWNGAKREWSKNGTSKPPDDAKMRSYLYSVFPMGDFKKFCKVCGVDEADVDVNLDPIQFTIGTRGIKKYIDILQSGEMYIHVNEGKGRILWVSSELIVEYSSSISKAEELVKKAFPQVDVPRSGLFRISSKDGKLKSVVMSSGSPIEFKFSDTEKLSSILCVVYLYLREVNRTYKQQYYEFADSLLTLFNGVQNWDKNIVSLELPPISDKLKISFGTTRGGEESAEVFRVLIQLGRGHDSIDPDIPLKDIERSGVSNGDAIDTPIGTKSADPSTNKEKVVVECSSPASKRVKLEQDKYIINFKKSDTSEDVFPIILFDTKGDRIVEDQVKSAFEGCKSSSTFIDALVSIFQIDRESLVDALLSYIQLPGKSINLDRDSNGWCYKIKGLNKTDLDKIEQKLKERQIELDQKIGKLESDQKTHREKILTLDIVLKLLNIDDYNKLESFLREKIEGFDSLEREAKSLRAIVQILHATPEKAREKVEYLSQALARGSSLKDTSLDELKSRIDEMAKSYKKTGELSSELESFFQQPDSLLLGTFPLIKEEVGSKYSYFTDSYNKLSSQMIIAEAIKSKLADPQLRSKLDLEINTLNEELRQYSLAIEVPQRGTSADPSRHKFVGYDSGGTRGQISSVSAWGLVELENGSYKRTIYKSEVRIYQ
ncbi:MAG: hypothetical protein LHW53_07450 [Candidatus Cloacimonetes bacterium]|nr:hypothetical protein [Candidatus Cloacimonadota bacterium]